MGCGVSIPGCGIGRVVREKEKNTRVVNNYYLNDDHSVEVKDSVVYRSKFGDTSKTCPYCSRKLVFPEEPNFCPYCERSLNKEDTI